MDVLCNINPSSKLKDIEGSKICKQRTAVIIKKLYHYAPKTGSCFLVFLQSSYSLSGQLLLEGTSLWNVTLVFLFIRVAISHATQGKGYPGHSQIRFPAN